MNTGHEAEAVGAEIRAEAAAQRISLNELAEAAGIARTSLYKYLDATRDMPVPVLIAIAGHLNVETSELLRRASNRAQSTN